MDPPIPYAVEQLGTSLAPEQDSFERQLHEGPMVDERLASCPRRRVAAVLVLSFVVGLPATLGLEAMAKPPPNILHKLDEYMAARCVPHGDGTVAKPPADGAKLVKVVLAHRRGIASARKTFPNKTRVDNCELYKEVIRNVSHWNKVFKVSTGSPTQDKIDGKDQQCSGVQLMHQGYKRMLGLGEALNNTYSGLLDVHARRPGSSAGATSFTQNIYAEAYDGRETGEKALSRAHIASTAALLDGWLGLTANPEGLGGEQIQDKVVIHERSAQAARHADGSEQADGPACPGTAAPDPEVWPENKTVRKAVSDLFPDGELDDWSFEDVADALESQGCHGVKLPCGSNGCMSSSLAAQLVAEADRWRTKRDNSTGNRLAHHPFLDQVVRHLEEDRAAVAVFGVSARAFGALAAALGIAGAGGSNAFGGGARGHALGGHIALELWDMGEVQPRAKSAPGFAVRVQYNGEDRTAGFLAPGVAGFGGLNLTSVGDIRGAVDRALGASLDLAEACKRHAAEEKSTLRAPSFTGGRIES